MKNKKGYLVILGFVLVPLLLFGTGNTSDDTSSTNNSPVSIFTPAVVNASADDLASQINNLLKVELEKEFGPLNDQIVQDETKIWGRVIAIDYELPGGNRLDDSWSQKVVEALDRLGITATDEGSEVRAEQQTIAGKVASSIQFTTARGVEDPDVIGFVAMFPPE